MANTFFYKGKQDSAKFMIYPNRSLSWTGNQLFFLTIFCVSFTIATAFAWHGLWLVVPFAGLEMLALAAALYFCARRLNQKEIVSINQTSVTINVQRQGRSQASCSLPRAWTQVVVSSPISQMEARHLWLRAQGKQVEIGAFLDDQEKQQLANALNRAIAY